jgi:uncharacterized damage-inducible protein DinB
MPDCRPWTLSLCALLEQGAELAIALDDETFACALALAPGGSVGAHLRHVADFVAALLRDLAGGAVDYDRREREERAEREPARARARLLRLRDEVAALGRLDPARELRVRSEACLVGAEWQRSTLARELGGLLSHTVHHYALIAVLLRARGVEPPAELGVAPSTLAHWREERAACAPRAG